MTAQASGDIEKRSCPHCSRWFNADRLAKHMGVCVKTKKKRRVFDVKQQRLEEEQKQAIKKETLEA